MNIISYFSRTYILNLPERTDRRRDMERMLSRMALTTERNRVEFFPAIRPDSPGAFPSIGARGCYFSHLEILRQAAADKLPNVLVMEDDLEIAPAVIANPEPVIETLNALDWDMVYLGHVLGDEIATHADRPLVEYDGPIMTGHFYAVHGRCLPALISFLEAVIARPPGHPDGGPMHLDGAYSTFRKLNPTIITLVASPSLGWQRGTRSDITPGPFDEIPVIRSLIEFYRRGRRGLGR